MLESVVAKSYVELGRQLISQEQEERRRIGLIAVLEALTNGNGLDEEDDEQVSR